MTTTIEHDHAPLEMRDGRLVGPDGLEIPRWATVYVCAWCKDGKIITAALKLAGYPVSHGICAKCFSPLIPGGINN